MVGPAPLQETKKGNSKQAQVRFRKNGSALPAPETKSSVIRLQGVTIFTGWFEKDLEQTTNRILFVKDYNCDRQLLWPGSFSSVDCPSGAASS